MKHQTYNIELALAPARVQTQLSNKRNVVLYLDRELVEKTRNLGFNLSKAFENHLRHLNTQFSQFNQLNNPESMNNEALWWAGPDPNRRPSARQAPGTPTETLLTRFREFLKVDLRRSDKTAYEHTYYIKKFLNALPKPIETVTAEDVRQYLKGLSSISSAQYKNILMALKVFFRDFLKAPETVASFKFPHQVFKPKQILSKEQLQQFYKCLKHPKRRHCSYSMQQLG